MTRAKFLKACVLAASTGVSAVGLPYEQPVERRPHGNVEGTWCGCEECDLWDEALQDRVRASVDTAIELFWHTIRAEYPFLPAHEVCMEHVLGDDLAETATDLICQMVENERT